jgi:hypothetical protein
MKRYLVHFLIAVPLLTVAMAGFNWWIDPYAIYRDREALLKMNTPLLVMNERVFKTVALTQLPADVVFLGTSVTDLGIGRAHPAFAGKQVLNLATFGQPITESRRLMERVLSRSKPNTIVLGLDLLAFNELLVPPSDYASENYSATRPYVLLLSISTFADAWKMWRHPFVETAQCCDADGFRMPKDEVASDANLHQKFISNERLYLREKYLPYPGCRFSWSRKAGGSSFDDLRAMIKLAHQHHVDLRLFISPSHARQWQTIAQAGLSGTWEEWKRELVRINEGEAQQLAVLPFVLLDFSGYDHISSEAVPAAENKEALMRWYSDSAHYTPALGALVVQRLFTASRESLPAAWGQSLNAQNLEKNLARIRVDETRYRQTHEQDIAEIRASALAVNAVKHCPNH